MSRQGPATASGRSVASEPAQAAAPPGTAEAAPTPDGHAPEYNPCHQSYVEQSNLVPPGSPTPTTANECLQAGGVPRDPGPLTWAKPGQYISPGWKDFTPTSFSSSQRLVTTYYFYWHDLTDTSGPGWRFYASGQFHRPPDPARYSFLLPETHLREFKDMQAAGIDFVLPDYWGEPGHPGRTTDVGYPHWYNYWSTEGIPAMVAAEDQLVAQGGKALPMGLFYDTTILANADLTTPNGKEYFYVNVRDYFSRIPPRYWAAIDGRPIVWLYDTLWVSRFDQSSLNYLSDRFAQDFGGLRPYIVAESQWRTSKGVDPPQAINADGIYAWGAGPSGYNADPTLTVAEVSPGFKNTAYCTGGPAANCFDVSREDGAYYERQLKAALASGHRIIAVETWNEFSEGTDIAETVQTGRRYIELTRAYADRFKGE